MDPNETSSQKTGKEKQSAWPVIFPGCDSRFPTEIGRKSCPEGSTYNPKLAKQQLEEEEDKIETFSLYARDQNG